MRLFCNLLSCDLRRTILSKRFLFAILMFSFVTILTMFKELPHLQPEVTSVLYIDYLARYLDFHILYLVFAAIPGTILFCVDWENQFLQSVIVRCSKKIYAISKAIACFISASLVVMLSEILTRALFRLRFPLMNELDAGLGIYDSLGSGNKILLYLFLKIVFESLCAGCLSVFALWVSTKITNSYVALATPLIAFYICSTVSFAFGFPAMLNMNSLSKGSIFINENLTLSILYILVAFTILSIAFGWLFLRSCSRRIENG